MFFTFFCFVGVACCHGLNQAVYQIFSLLKLYSLAFLSIKQFEFFYIYVLKFSFIAYPELALCLIHGWSLWRHSIGGVWLYS